MPKPTTVLQGRMDELLEDSVGQVGDGEAMPIPLKTYEDQDLETRNFLYILIHVDFEAMQVSVRPLVTCSESLLAGNK